MEKLLKICFSVICTSKRIRQGSFILIICFLTKFSSAQKPIAYYTFDNTVADKSGFNNDGIIHGDVSATTDRFGNACSAMYFDGKTGYIEVPSSPSLESPSSQFSVSVWYKLPANTSPINWLTILCKGFTNTEIQNPQYRLQVQQNFSSSVNSCNTGTAGSSTISISTDFTKCDNDFQQHLFESDKWCYYTLTYDGNYVRAYMNGVKVFDFYYSLPFTRNTSPLFIGLDEPGVTEYFEGALDDLRIYNKALSENDINDLYNESNNTLSNMEEFELESPQNKVVFLSGNNCTASVNFNTPEVTSHCGSVSLVQIAGLPSGSSFNCGKHLISYEAKSASGYEQNCSFYIIVKDEVPPTLIVPNDTILFVQQGEKGIHYTYQSPVASDNCKLKNINLVSGNQSGSFFSIGRNTISYNAIDIYDNKTSKTFSIIVKEKEIAVIPIKADTIKKIVKIDSVSTTIKKDTVKTVYKTDSLFIPIKIDSIQQTTKSDSQVVLKPIESIDVKKDSAVIQSEFILRKIKKEKQIEVESPKLRLEIYDNGEIDGDTISLFLNHKVLLLNQLIGLKPIVVDIEIDSTIDNELALFAENLGSIPPNTALLILWDGDKRVEINLTSTMKTNGAIILRKKKVVK